MGALDRIETVIKNIEISRQGDHVTLQVEMSELPDDDGAARKFRTQHAVQYLTERGYDIYSCVEDAELLGNIKPFKRKGVWKFNVAKPAPPPLSPKKKIKKTANQES